jgi:predicted dehydrogenase
LDEINHFLECIETGRPPLVTLRDARESLRMALQAKNLLADASPAACPS